MPEPTVKRALKIQAGEPEDSRVAAAARETPLLNRRGILAGGIAALAAPFGALPTSTEGVFNDFYTYWAASRLLSEGRDPYDVGAISAILHQYGISGLTGSGYSYPLFLAELLRPFTVLPPNVAALLFGFISLAALALGVALLASGIPRLAADASVLFGAVSGFLTPVAGS